MEEYDTIGPIEDYPLDNLDKTYTRRESYENLKPIRNDRQRIRHVRQSPHNVLQTTCQGHQSTRQLAEARLGGVSATTRIQLWLLFFFAMTGAILGIVSVCLIALEKVSKVESVDGSWSEWNSWEACTSTCDVGMQRRRRNCSDPAPSGDGRQCLGLESEHQLCFPGPCLLSGIDGSWSDWEPWGACSTSCGVGMQIRHRKCSNPVPSGNGRQCLGVDMEQKTCFPGSCSVLSNAPVVVFRAANVTSVKRYLHQEIVFKDVHINEGNSYNSTNGKFTAPVSGIYLFSVHLCAQDEMPVHYALAGPTKLILRGYYYEYYATGTCTSFSVPVTLKQSEDVYVIIEDEYEIQLTLSISKSLMSKFRLSRSFF